MMLVVRSYLCGLVHVWDFQDSVDLELEDTLSATGSSAYYSIGGTILPPRVSKVCILSNLPCNNIK